MAYLHPALINGGVFLAPLVPVIPLIPLFGPDAPCVLARRTTSGAVRIVLQFADTPAPRDRTIILGGQGRTITSG